MLQSIIVSKVKSVWQFENGKVCYERKCCFCCDVLKFHLKIKEKKENIVRKCAKIENKIQIETIKTKMFTKKTSDVKKSTSKIQDSKKVMFFSSLVA